MDKILILSAQIEASEKLTMFLIEQLRDIKDDYSYIVVIHRHVYRHYKNLEYILLTTTHYSEYGGCIIYTNNPNTENLALGSIQVRSYEDFSKG